MAWLIGLGGFREVLGVLYSSSQFLSGFARIDLQFGPKDLVGG